MLYNMTWLERILFLKRKGGGGTPAHEATSYTGSFITDMVAPLKKLLVTLAPIQSGSGDPSPDNVRPISGHTEVVTTVSPTTDAEDGTSYTTDLGRTVYGGTLDVVSGELNVDRAIFTFDGDTSKWTTPVNWYNVDVADSNPTFGVYWYFNYVLGWNSLPKPKLYVNSTDNAKVVSDKLTQNNYGTYKQSEPYKACISGSSTNSVYLGVRLPASVLSDTSSSDALNASVMEWFQNNPTEFCYLLAEPITIQLSPQQINSLIGQNNIITEDGVEVDEIVYMTRLVGSPLLGNPQTEDEPTEEIAEESREVGEDG